MKGSSAQTQPTSRPRKALAEHLSVIADLRVRIGALAGGARASDVDQSAEHVRRQLTLAAAIAKRDVLIADVMVAEELPRRIKAYQDLVMQVNAAWNDILAFDDAMRRRFPGRPSIFNTAGPHERAVLAPSTDRSPIPPIEIDSRELFAAASTATDRFVEALASDAEAKFGRS